VQQKESGNKTILPIFVGLLGPLLIAILSIWLFALSDGQIPSSIVWLPLLAILAVTGGGIIWYFVQFKQRGTWALPAGFLIPGAASFITETLNPELFQYLFTTFVFLFYSLPFAFISAVVFIIIKMRMRNR